MRRLLGYSDMTVEEKADFIVANLDIWWLLFGAYIVFFMHVAGWIAVDAAIMGGLGGPVNRVEYWAAWFFREITAFPLYCYAMAGERVTWRGRGYKLVFDGTVRVDEGCRGKESGGELKGGWREEQEKESIRNEIRRCDSKSNIKL